LPRIGASNNKKIVAVGNEKPGHGMLQLPASNKNATAEKPEK
jgi:hypothetical protein